MLDLMAIEPMHMLYNIRRGRNRWLAFECYVAEPLTQRKGPNIPPRRHFSHTSSRRLTLIQVIASSGGQAVYIIDDKEEDARNLKSGKVVEKELLRSCCGWG